MLTAHVGLAGSLLGAAALHVGWAEQADAVAQTLSDYALVDGGGRIFTGTVICLAAGSAALLAGLVRSGLPVGGPAKALLGAWCGGLVLTVVFPTDPAGSTPSVRGLVHRYTAGGAVAALPLAGLLIARRLGVLPGWQPTARSLRRTSWASVAGGLAFLGAHLCATAPVTPMARSIAGGLGLAERVTFGLETVLLFVLAGAVRASRGRR
ncbi:DUF998 domain-containing protein [Streptomyces sp. NPDC059743]|uniref:DUF998 domain-containing protein n=1 Tax=Streptomyces sp. NPDC059743 TaxID=3346928 RepID=UPI0036670C2A